MFLKGTAQNPLIIIGFLIPLDLVNEPVINIQDINTVW